MAFTGKNIISPAVQPQVVIGQNSLLEKYPRFISRLSLIFSPVFNSALV
jgi:hypothetical protein